MLDRAESPAREASCRRISVARASQNTLDTVGTDEFDLNIATAAMLNPNLDCDVLQRLEVVLAQRILRDLHFTRDASLDDSLPSTHTVEDVHGTVANLDRWHFNPCLRFNGLPVLRRVDELNAAKCAIAVLVAETTSASSSFPVGVIGVDLYSSTNTKMLQIPPVEVGAGMALSIGVQKDKWVTYRTLSARAKIPAAFGAAADVPPCVCAHLFLPTSVVV